MSSFSSAVSDDKRFSTSDIGVYTNLKTECQHTMSDDNVRISHIFPTPW